MIVRKWILAGAALLTFAAPASAAEFIATVGSAGVGSPSCTPSGVTSGMSSAPASRELTCAPVGGGSLVSGFAASTFGHVGASADFASPATYFGTAFGMSAFSRFFDFVTFTSTDPMATSTTIAANIAFSGTLAASEAAVANVDARWLLFGGAVGDRVLIGNNSLQINTFTIVSGNVSTGSSNALLRGRTFTVPLNSPILIGMDITVGAGGPGGGSSARSEFSNSFEVPFGMDAFVLPEGVTANAGDWLVDNRRVDPNAVNPIPEPSTWAMLIAGFGLVGGSLRARARTTAKKDYAPCL